MTSTDINGSPILILSQNEARWLEERLTTMRYGSYYEYNRQMIETILQKANECLDSDQPN